MIWFLLTIIQLVGLDNFDSIVRDAAALYLLRQRQNDILIHFPSDFPSVTGNQ